MALRRLQQWAHVPDQIDRLRRRVQNVEAQTAKLDAGWTVLEKSLEVLVDAQASSRRDTSRSRILGTALLVAGGIASAGIGLLLYTLPVDSSTPPMSSGPPFLIPSTRVATVQDQLMQRAGSGADLVEIELSVDQNMRDVRVLAFWPSYLYTAQISSECVRPGDSPGVSRSQFQFTWPGDVALLPEYEGGRFHTCRSGSGAGTFSTIVSDSIEPTPENSVVYDQVEFVWHSAVIEINHSKRAVLLRLGDTTLDGPEFGDLGPE